MMPALSHTAPTTPAASAGGRLIAQDGRELPLRATTLRADACAGRARSVVEQRFVNPYAEPLTVLYRLPLPADGAVSGFSFVIGGERIVGRIERRAEARELFEAALAQGRSGALLEEERSSVFTQEVGNIPAGAEVTAEIVVDHPLRWLPDGAWEWRFPTVVAPRYLGGTGRVADADQISVDVVEGGPGPACRFVLAIRDALAAGGRAASSSHALLASPNSGDVGGLGVELAEAGSGALDRDVVVTWPVATPTAGVTLDVARPDPGHARGSSAFALLTLVPARKVERRVSRDLIVLLDTSGSMAGEPIEQAKRVVGALIDGLSADDRLELIEFGSEARRFRRGALPATAANRSAARAWLGKVRASGATEMRTAITEALGSLRAEAQRQVLVVTDGLIGFEEEIVGEVLRRLSSGSRVHTLGIGSSVNRSLTGPLARAGRGSEHIAEIGVDVEPVVERLLARMEEPAIVELAVSGSAVRSLGTSHLPDLMGGAPALLPLELDAAGGELVVTGRTADGAWEQRVRVAPIENGAGSAALAALFAREQVEDLELRIAAGQPRERLEREIERVGLAFGVSTRLTSWVAVTEQQTVDPTLPTRRVSQPQRLPHGMSVEGLGLRRAAPMLAAAPMALAFGAPPAEAFGASMAAMAEPLRARPAPAAATPGPKRSRRLLRRLADVFAPKREDLARGVLFEAEEDLPHEAAAPRARLRGRITREHGEELVIEATIEDSLDWTLPAVVELELADGSSLTCAVVRERSTAATMLTPGQTVRIVVRRSGTRTAPPVAALVGDISIDLNPGTVLR